MTKFIGRTSVQHQAVSPQGQPPYNKHPAVWGGARTFFPKLGLLYTGYSSVARLSRSFCAAVQKDLDSKLGIAKLCIAAMRSLTALSAFLDVSSLNLAAPLAPPFSCR